MLRNYLKVAFRNILRYKLYSFINLAGLAVGMTCCILIFLYVRYELSYDRYHADYDQIYRINSSYSIEGSETRTASSPAPLVTVFKDFYPEVQSTTRFIKFGFNQKKLISYKGNKFYDNDIYYADSSVGDVFSYPIIKGDSHKILQKANSIVLTKSFAKKIFKNENPVGKKLQVGSKAEFLVTGLMEDIPENSHLKFSALVSMATLYDEYGEFIKDKWWPSWSYSYVKLKKGANPAVLEEGFHKIYDKYMAEKGKSLNTSYRIEPQPIARIHLYSDRQGETSPVGDINYLYIFSAVALFILIIACINYMNLATARFAGRSKEVGIRKVLGSDRKRLFGQFIFESLLLSFLAAVLALVITETVVPFFESFSGKKLMFGYLGNPELIISVLFITLLVGLLSGTYPAFFLSRFNPTEVLKGKMKPGVRRSRLRRFMVVFQFTVSVIIIIGTTLAHRQLNFMKSKKLGFDYSGLLALDINVGLSDTAVADKIPELKKKLAASKFIKNVSITSTVPGSELIPRRIVRIEKKGKLAEEIFQFMSIDDQFIPTMNIALKQGRNFCEEDTAEYKTAIIVNESMVKKMGWKQPLNKRIQTGFEEDGSLSEKEGIDARVIGVIKDFHLQSLHEKIEPLIIFKNKNVQNKLLIRYDPVDESESKAQIEAVWNAVYPNLPPENHAVAEIYADRYRAEEKTVTIFTWFSFVSVFIACLGLFGLASFMTERRGREIAIRKVLGAGIRDILWLIWKEFIRLIVIAVLIAWPIAYFASDYLLNKFPYRIEIDLVVFLTAGAAALLVGIVTVSWHAFRSAFTSPALRLKYE